MARPSKKAHALPAVLEALRLGCSRAGACAAAGVTPPTLREWCRKETAVQIEVEGAEAEAERHAVVVIRTAAEHGSWKAAAWLLERRWPSEWGRRDQLQVDIREHAARLADEFDLDADELVREAQNILSQGRMR